LCLPQNDHVIFLTYLENTILLRKYFNSDYNNSPKHQILKQKKSNALKKKLQNKQGKEHVTTYHARFCFLSLMSEFDLFKKIESERQLVFLSSS
jgi:hypothetical protein